MRVRGCAIRGLLDGVTVAFTTAVCTNPHTIGNSNDSKHAAKYSTVPSGVVRQVEHPTAFGKITTNDVNAVVFTYPGPITLANWLGRQVRNCPDANLMSLCSKAGYGRSWQGLLDSSANLVVWYVVDLA